MPVCNRHQVEGDQGVGVRVEGDRDESSFPRRRVPSGGGDSTNRSEGEEGQILLMCRRGPYPTTYESIIFRSFSLT